jgi:hypothetical protein
VLPSGRARVQFRALAADELSLGIRDGDPRRIFRDDGRLLPLRLIDGQVTNTGAALATYAPAA